MLPLRCMVGFLAVAGAVEAQAVRLWLEAEDMAGPWRRQTNISGYRGAGFRTSNANPRAADEPLEGTVAVPEAGTYVAWSRGYTSPGGRRAFAVEVAGHRFKPQHGEGPRGWWWRRCGEVILPAGPCSVRLLDAGTGFESADVILLTNAKDDDPMAEDRQWLSFAGELPGRANALAYTIEACCALAAKRVPPADAETWENASDTARRRLAAALGLDPMPPRTALQARISGQTATPYGRVENIVFESRPGFLVTANLIVPNDLRAPAPAVVVVPGHAMAEGKNYPPYRRAQMGLARLGFVVLAYDPIGQGERRRPGFDHILGYGSLMVGQCNEGMIVWDTIRAVDYLCSRPEVDASRIGLTGNSGGGENTFYAMPLEPRLAAGASFCFVCSYEQWIRHGGNHCICNHMPGILHHLEQYEILALNAPRPFLVGNAAEDRIFPIAGTRQTLERARERYAQVGAEGALRWIETPGGHGWSQPLREAAYGWFAHWLLGSGDGAPIPEPALDDEPADAPHLLCLKTPDVWPEDAETVVTLNRKRAAELAASRSPATREGLWRLFGDEPVAFTPVSRTLHAFPWQGATVRTLALDTEAGMCVGVTVLRPAVADVGAGVLFVTDGERRNLVESALVAALLAAGRTVAVVNPRGTGEAEVHANHVTSDTVCLGRPLLAQQVWDALQAADWLAADLGIAPAKITLVGSDACSFHVLYAAALRKAGRAAMVRLPASYVDLLENSLRYPLWAYVPGVLGVADVPEVLALTPDSGILVLNPVGPGGRALDEGAARECLGLPPAAAAGAAAGGRIAAVTDGETDALARWLCE
ncbi:MAG: acetylxylan esterase [Lentisphaeria bacterium]|nr:acetylxylan esterase [Lentisphaeria bacterium]